MNHDRWLTHDLDDEDIECPNCWGCEMDSSGDCKRCGYPDADKMEEKKEEL